MTLNKEICKKCCNLDGRAPWNRQDEKDWRDGNIVCPYGNHLADVKRKAPKYCKYILEQVVNEPEQKDL